MSSAIFVSFEYQGEYEKVIDFIKDKDWTYEVIPQKEKNKIMLKLENATIDEVKFFNGIAIDDKTGTLYNKVQELTEEEFEKAKKEYLIFEEEEKKKREIEKEKANLAAKESIKEEEIQEETPSTPAIDISSGDEKINDILNNIPLPPKEILDKNDPMNFLINSKFLPKFIFGGIVLSVVFSWFN